MDSYLSRVTNTNYRRAYLNLNERFSQTWLNRYTVVLVLMIFKLLLFRISLNNSLTQAKEETYSTCSKAETYASSLTSMPHYISKGANILIAKGLTETNKGFMEMLDIILTGSKNLIVFALEMTIGTYVCVLTATVDATAYAALNATESVISVANDTVKGLAEEIQDGLDDVSKVVNALVSAYEKVKDFFEDDDDGDDVNNSIDKVNLTIASLKKWQIPSSINTKLDTLAKEVPNFDDVMNYTESLINEPFDYLKNKVAEQVDLEFDPQELSVPDKQTMTFCSNSGIDKFYEDLANILHKASIVMFVILLVMALTFVLVEAFMEKRQWNRINEISENVQQVEATSASEYKGGLAVELVEMVRNRYSFLIGQKLGDAVFGPSVARLNRFKWVVSYIFSDRASMVLLLGLAGILTFILQTVLLALISGHDSNTLESSFKSISHKVTTQVNDSMTEWAKDTNIYISDQEDSINDSCLGWIHNTTGTLNSTLSEFIDEMNSKISDIFGDTPLYDYVSGIVGCTVTRKLEKVEEAMSWLNEHSQVSLPRIDPSDFNTTDSSDSGTIDSYLHKTKEALTETKDLLVRKYRSALRIELYISLVLLGLWLLMVLVALILSYFKERKEHAESEKQVAIEHIGTMSESDPDTVFGSPESSDSFISSEKPKFNNLGLDPSDYFSGPGNINQTLHQLLTKLRGRNDSESTHSLDSLETVVTFHSETLLEPFGQSSGSFADSTIETAHRWQP
ncbi:hypothetical protein OGAPHI_007273 [Ogataea philodendri]|uniref:Plasma membrane fusion protein PRM1 n=1 Tax=Ogataea philodendri TaxID=1378263 RepID=A0A9P8NTH8_9ASCO|nr:uncharacterized protein OGAPHI_007273 [Ogataea philodendri]KAH3660068.1 hypothetical protein OGAPHI_007273 [Ogataea philodendri]